MLKKLTIAGAKIVQSGLSVFIADETILRALPVTSKEKVALTALSGQRVVLQPCEGLLFVTIHEACQRLLADISQSVLGIDEVVAGIDVAIKLHHSRMAAHV